MHHSFLTASGIYVLTFSLENLLLKGEFSQVNTIRYLNYWLKSIKYHSPGASLMLIGTHLDSVKESVSDLQKEMSHVDNILGMIVYPKLQVGKEAIKMKGAIDAANDFAKTLDEQGGTVTDRKLNVLQDDKRLFFAVDLSGSNNKTVEAVRKKLDESAPKQEYFAKSVPAKWMKFLDLMITDGHNWIEASKVKACAAETLKGSDDIEKETVQALDLLHELGYIIHITNLKSYKGCVITNPHWLVDATTKIMYNEDVKKFDDDQAAKAGLSEDVKNGLKKGLISRNLLEFLWGEQDVGFFLKFLEQNLLMCRWGFDKDKKKPNYIVPSLVPRMNSRVDGPDSIDKSELKAYFTFGNYLTLGVFERLVCQVIQSTLSGFPESKAPKIYAGYSHHYLGDDFEFALRRENNFIVCSVLSSKKAPIKCVTRLLKMFQKLGDLLGKGFSVNTSLIVDKEYVEYSQVKAKKMAPWY
uniref:COR domain-containing protein n=1 Tax=Aplanochytrium stocchinoi TaxID=215587 RepID=A0A7S3PFJ1_9STRA